MSELSGLELAKSLQEIDDTMKLIFVTGYPSYAVPAFEVNAIGYILKPYNKERVEKEIQKAKRIQLAAPKSRVFVRTFGRFDIFVDGIAVHFSSAKAKELLAILIDRQGGIVTMEQAITILWENREYDLRVKNLYRAVSKSLRDTLKNAGISDILIENRNSRSINKTKLDCDYYQLLDGKPEAKKHFFGEYMFEYSWAEITLTQIQERLG